jgi:hypothetical protein
MTGTFVRAGIFATIGLGAALAGAPSAEASQEKIGEYLKRHHIKSYHGKRVHAHRPSRFGDEPGVYRIVRVEPDHGTRVYYAPVRHAPLGDQIRLQSGTWQYCEITCEYTFRKYGPDFWDSQAESGIYPRFLRFEFHLD